MPFRHDLARTLTTTSIPATSKNIVRIDSVDFSTKVVVRFRHENDRPPRAVHPSWAVPEPRPPAPRNSSAPPSAGDCELSTMHATTFSLASTAVLDLPLPPMVRLPADTAGLQARYLGTVAPQGRSTYWTRKSRCREGGIGFLVGTRVYSTEAGSEFDDMVVWVPCNILLSRMARANKLP
jgi:hypothetical protein